MSTNILIWLSICGSLCFGIVIGWITHRTLRRSTPSGLSDIATVIGAIGGAAVTGLFRRDTGDFGAYCIGLLMGFFAYLSVAIKTTPPQKRKTIGDWLGTEPMPDPFASHSSPNIKDVDLPPGPPASRGGADDDDIPVPP
jgi:hypothetical protein